MNDALLPTRYCLELYIGNFSEDPVATFHSTTPFLSVSVGDTLDPYIWPGSSLHRGEVARVLALRHLVFQVAGDHNTHKLMVSTELIPTPEWQAAERLDQ